MSSSDDRLNVLQRSAPVARPPTRRGARLTALALILGVLAVAWVALKPMLFPPRPVEVAPVEAGEAATSTANRAGVVEAQGWIEAAPWARMCSRMSARRLAGITSTRLVLLCMVTIPART